MYIYQLPLSIYIGKGDRAEQIRGIEIQLIWLLILSVIFVIAQNKVTRKVLVQGG